MININFSITNPFADDLSDVVFSRYGKVTKNKYWSITLHKHSRTIIDLLLDVYTRRSNAGILLWIGLLGYFLEFRFYDCGHRYSNKWENA
nr:MAG: hypothetical protein [Caudoviricetes sp.]